MWNWYLSKIKINLSDDGWICKQIFKVMYVVFEDRDIIKSYLI